MRHTGGVAFATVSIRSKPLAWANRNASLRDMTPSCCLASSRTRTSRARILPFRRCSGSREWKEREGNGRLREPPLVGDESRGETPRGTMKHYQIVTQLNCCTFQLTGKQNGPAAN